MPKQPSTGFDLTDEWDPSAYIASQQWDLVSAPQAHDSGASTSPNGSANAEGQSTNPDPSSSDHDSGLAPDTSVIAERLLSQPSTSILSLLDSLRCGAFLLDLRGRVLSLNAIARGCLGDGLTLSGKHLSASDRATDQGLQTMIASAAGRGDEPNGSLSVAIQRRSRLPLVIRAVRQQEAAQGTPNAASVLLLAIDPELRREPPREMLMQAFGLTAAEADIAIGIASGKTLSEIATDRGIKIGTVRDYSKNVFLKTYTRGQAQLTGLLTRLAFLASRRDETARSFTAKS
jgi:DNA-binding CsgD family transcriptional regulator